ncbi:MAG: hypothetical protein ABEI52_02155, partial [Halobacteriaceae archaeon]
KYMQVKQKTDQIASALQSPSCTGVAELMSSTGQADTSNMCSYMREQAVGKLSAVGSDLWSDALSAKQKLENLDGLMKRYSQFRHNLQTNACQALSPAARTKLLETISSSSNLGDRASKGVQEVFLDRVEQLSYAERREVLRESRRESDSVKEYIASKRDTNKNFNAMAKERSGVEPRPLNELGLTQSQTTETLGSILRGEIGQAARGVVASHMIPHLSGASVRDGCQRLLRFSDDTIQRRVAQVLQQAPEKVKTELWNKAVQELPRRELRSMAGSLSSKAQQRLTQYYAENLQGQFRNIVSNIRKDMFKKIKCPPNPFAH